MEIILLDAQEKGAKVEAGGKRIGNEAMRVSFLGVVEPAANIKLHWRSIVADIAGAPAASCSGGGGARRVANSRFGAVASRSSRGQALARLPIPRGKE
jgi:hypothetical protein